MPLAVQHFELVAESTRKLEAAMHTLRVVQTRVQDISDHARDANEHARACDDALEEAKAFAERVKEELRNILSAIRKQQKKAHKLSDDANGDVERAQKAADTCAETQTLAAASRADPRQN